MIKEEVYQGFTDHEHVLKKPSTYIGTISNNNSEFFTCNESGEGTKRSETSDIECTIIKKNILYNQGLFKIFDEPIVNAIDHSVKYNSVTKISVEVNQDEGYISITNNGPGIPVKLQDLFGKDLYIPEIVSCNLRTSSNYDDDKERIVGGTNGFGLSLTNIYSKRFIIETLDSTRKLYYRQEITDNMYKIAKPEIKSSAKASYTKITFYPDLKKFKLNELSNDLINLMKKRTFDIKACVDKKVQVYFNKENINIKDFVDYTSLYFGNEGSSATTRKPDAYEKFTLGDYIWEIAVYRHNEFQQVSFVNGVNTLKGGKHVEYILKQISKKLLAVINSKKKIENIKAKYIEDHLFLFIRATINQPEFTSQTKEELGTPASKFFADKNMKIEISESFINKLYKCGLVQDIINLTNFKNQKEISKVTDGSKKVRIDGITKLNDAEWAGTKKSIQCTLILVEGDSGKENALQSRSVLGSDKYGVFCMKGKPLNVRNASVSQLLNNEELNNIKTILGLKQNEVYSKKEDLKKLRYGKVVLFTDSDVDGSHIKCLFINFIDTFWKDLKALDFIETIKTPIVKATKGKKIIEFFTQQDYEKQKDSLSGYNIKYYKGIGTSKAHEAKEIFKRKNELQVTYFRKDKICDEAILLAFDKDKNAAKTENNSSVGASGTLKCSDQRKEWLRNYNKDDYLDVNTNKVSFSDLINKELKHFSIYDNQRSIPSLCDGLKPSTRKILYYMLKKNITSELKVAQLSGYISADLSYHHGEESLNKAIVGMAQDFVDANNINLLSPEGSFGSLHTGKASSPRYIYTKLSDITKFIFNPDDLSIIEYLQDDGQQIEPMYFIPVVPMVLINGADGIGTGFSTFIPKYNIKDIIINIKRLIKDEKPYKLIPWYNKFLGTIEKSTTQDVCNFVAKGKYIRSDNTKIKITVLPIGTYFDNYKEYLEKISEHNKENKSPIIKTYNELVVEDSIHFTVEFNSKDELDKLIEANLLEKKLKLTKNINTTNMHLFNKDLILTKYTNPNQILLEFYKFRLPYYEQKRQYKIADLKSRSDVLLAKTRFIREYTDNVLDINKKPKDYITKLLQKRNYPTFEPKLNYDYLISMPISSITLEKIKELEAQRDIVLKELEYYQNSTDKSLWLEDLELLEQQIKLN